MNWTFGKQIQFLIKNLNPRPHSVLKNVHLKNDFLPRLKESQKKKKASEKYT